MNGFEVRGQVLRIVPKVSKHGDRYALMRIETFDGQRLAFAIHGRPPGEGALVSVEGRLTGFGDFIGAKVDEIRILHDRQNAQEEKCIDDLSDMDGIDT